MNQRQDVRTFARFINNPFYDELRPAMKDLFEKSVYAHRGSYPVLDLQAELLAHIIFADSANKKYLRFKARFGRALRGLSGRSSPPERMNRAQSRIQDMQAYATAAKLVGHQLRSIGDGIAWRFLDYDRATLRLLAEHAHVSVPQVGIGLQAELNEMQRLADEGYGVLLNSITNFLRVGDITIRDETTGRITLVEVKAGTNRILRTTRQGKHMALVQQGLDKGSHSIPGVTLTKLMSKAPLKTHITSVDSAMSQAQQEYGASRLFGDYLSVGAFAIRKIVDDLSEADMARLQHTIMERCLSVARRTTDMVLPLMSNLLPIVRFSPIFAPYAIFPIDQNRRFDLFSGDYWVISLLNVSGLARWLEKRRWEVKIVAPPNRIDYNAPFHHVPVMRVWKGNKGVEIGLDALLLAAMEFWQQQSIEEWITAVLSGGKPLAGYYQVVSPNTGKYAWD